MILNVVLTDSLHQQIILTITHQYMRLTQTTWQTFLNFCVILTRYDDMGWALEECLPSCINNWNNNLVITLIKLILLFDVCFEELCFIIAIVTTMHVMTKDCEIYVCRMSFNVQSTLELLFKNLETFNKLLNPVF